MDRNVVLGPVAQMTRSQANQAREELLRPINEGIYAPTQRMTFAAFCDRWQREVLVHERDSTGGFYTKTLERYIRPYFDKWQLEDMKPPEIQTFINYYDQYSKSVLKHIRATLSKTMERAVTWQYIKVNPVLGLKLPEGKKVKRVATLVTETILLIIGKLPEPFPMVVLLAGTVIRECELLALKWEDIDFINQFILVRRSLYRGQIDEDTDEDTSTRNLPAGPVVMHFLAALKASEHNRGEYVFTTSTGTLFTSDSNIRTRVFNPCAEALKIPRFSFRSFRRTSATYIHNSNVPLKVQREIMGHTEEETSLIYTEAEIKTQRETLRNLERAMFNGICLIVPNCPNPGGMVTGSQLN